MELRTDWVQFRLRAGMVGMVLRCRKVDFAVASRFVELLIEGGPNASSCTKKTTR